MIFDKNFLIDTFQVAKLLINYILQKVEKIIEHRDLYGDEESPPFFKFFNEPVDPEGEEMEGYEGEIENEIETPPELAELIIYWISLDLCLVRNLIYLHIKMITSIFIKIFVIYKYI